MKYIVMTDAILIVHFLFVIFVVFGGILIFYRRWMLFIHFPAVLWGAWIEFSGWICPLTPLENRFRALAGLSGYQDGFIQQYLFSIIYPDGMTRKIQVFLGLSVLVINFLVYAAFFIKTTMKKR